MAVIISATKDVIVFIFQVLAIYSTKVGSFLRWGGIQITGITTNIPDARLAVGEGKSKTVILVRTENECYGYPATIRDD